MHSLEAPGPVEGGTVELRIVMNDLDPPSGCAVLYGHDARAFVGWLELIELVERLKGEYVESGRTGLLIPKCSDREGDG